MSFCPALAASSADSANAKESKNDDMDTMMMDFMLKRADYHDTVSICSIPVTRLGNTNLQVLDTVAFSAVPRPPAREA